MDLAVPPTFHPGQASCPAPPMRPVCAFDALSLQEQQAATLKLQMKPVDIAIDGRQLLRARPAEEMEPASWPGAPQGSSLVRLRSATSSRPQVFVTFKNATQRTVHLLWLDHRGNEIILNASTCILQPGGPDSEWYSFCTHPWLARDATSGMRLLLDGRQAFVVGSGDVNRVFPITEPPRMEWTHASHRHFPAVHRAAVRTVLLCHHRLQRATTPPLALLWTGGEAAGGFAEHSAAYLPAAPAHPSPASYRPHKRARFTLEGAGTVSSTVGIAGGDSDGGVANPPAPPAVSQDAAAAAAATLGLSSLPTDLVLCIIAAMAPDVPPFQDVAAHPHGHADILPALLEGDPATWPPMLPAPAPPPPHIPAAPGPPLGHDVIYLLDSDDEEDDGAEVGAAAGGGANGNDEWDEEVAEEDGEEDGDSGDGDGEWGGGFGGQGGDSEEGDLEFEMGDGGGGGGGGAGYW